MTKTIRRGLLRQLENIDWDFPAPVPGVTKAIHWYPGSFTSALPATLVQALCPVDGLVFDPWGGIGTAGVEAVRLGRRAWLVEQNPVGMIASYVAVALVLLSRRSNDLVDAILTEVSELVRSSSVTLQQPLPLGDRADQLVDASRLLERMLRPKPDRIVRQLFRQCSPNWGALESWVERTTLKNIKRAWTALAGAETAEFVRALGFIMLSDRLRANSSQTRSWGHIADCVLPREYQAKPVGTAWNGWLARVRNRFTRIDHLQVRSSRRCAAFTVMHDWTEVGKPRGPHPAKADLLLTSPPYGNAIDYTRAQRLSLYLLGFTDAAIRKLSTGEVGARWKRFGGASKRHWAEELAAATTVQLSLLKSGAPVAFVLPHEESGRDIGARAIDDALENAGWSRVFQAVRSISKLRVRQSWSSIRREYVRVYLPRE